MKYSFLVVEGPHDVAAVGKMLEIFDFKIVRNKNSVDPYWIKIIPNKFPYQDDLLRRIPVPTFYQKSGYSVAVYAAGGYEKLSKAIELSIINFDSDKLHSVGVFCDADNQEPYDRCREVCDSLRRVKGFSEIGAPGQVIGRDFKVGVYVFPDNRTNGTLEDLLIDSARELYPRLLDNANTYISQVDNVLKQNWGRTDESKVLFGSLANVFQPGKANQMTIQNDDWISHKTLDLSKVNSLRLFVSELLEIELVNENGNTINENYIEYP